MKTWYRIQDLSRKCSAWKDFEKDFFLSENFRSKKIWLRKYFWSEKKFWSEKLRVKKILGPKKFRVQKYLDTKIFGHKIELKKFKSKKIWDLPLKFGQNWVSNSWDIPDIYKYRQNKCWLDNCQLDSWNLL